MQVVPLGDSALLVRIAQASPASDDAVLAAMQTLQARTLRGVVELVPSYASIGVFYDAAALSDVASPFERLKSEIVDALSVRPPTTLARDEPRVIEIPICYDAEFAFDLEAVAQHTRLSTAEVVHRHSVAEYRVSCVGFTPGFPYLAGLPAELATPRRGTPRTEVPAGSVGIGGSQTGIYPQKSPGGWNIIGRTSLRLFDPEEQPPALLRAGDRVRFRAITRDEFDGASREASR
jgi:inhibitor of KinA